MLLSNTLQANCNTFYPQTPRTQCSMESLELTAGLTENKSLRDEFNSMQNIYVFDANDKIDFHAVISSLTAIRERLLSECL